MADNSSLLKGVELKTGKNKNSILTAIFSEQIQCSTFCKWGGSHMGKVLIYLFKTKKLETQKTWHPENSSGWSIWNGKTRFLYDVSNTNQANIFKSVKISHTEYRTLSSTHSDTFSIVRTHLDGAEPVCSTVFPVVSILWITRWSKTIFFLALSRISSSTDPFVTRRYIFTCKRWERSKMQGRGSLPAWVPKCQHTVLFIL